MSVERRGPATRGQRLDAFTRQYIETALWSTNDESDERGGEPLDENYSISDIAPETMKMMIEDCAEFQEQYSDLLAASGLDDEKAGHYFWLSRNGHGAGFFDEDLNELQEAAKSYGEVDLYVGDDGLIYGSESMSRSQRRSQHVSAPRQVRSGGWSVVAGRQIYFDGRPFIGIDREGETRPVEADGATHLIVELFNRSSVTPDTIYEKHMGHPRKNRR